MAAGLRNPLLGRRLHFWPWDTNTGQFLGGARLLQRAPSTTGLRNPLRPCSLFHSCMVACVRCLRVSMSSSRRMSEENRGKPVLKLSKWPQVLLAWTLLLLRKRASPSAPHSSLPSPWCGQRGGSVGMSV